MRCGLHYGEVMIANLGGERQVQLTASGDVVNTASRLEGLTRDLGAAVAISAPVDLAAGSAADEQLRALYEREWEWQQAEDAQGPARKPRIAAGRNAACMMFRCAR